MLAQLLFCVVLLLKQSSASVPSQLKITDLTSTSDTKTYGRSVAIAGDWAAIGDIADTTNGFYAGAVYIFKKDGDNWVQQQLLLGTNELGYFGDVVVMDEDNLFVSADNVVLWYVRSGDNWALAANSNSVIDAGPFQDEYGDQCFGCWMDFDGTTLAISTFDAGAAFAYSLDGGAWKLNTLLKPIEPITYAQQHMGAGISIYKDLIVVGSQGDLIRDFPGSAFVFNKVSNTGTDDWQYTQELSPGIYTNGGAVFGDAVKAFKDTIVVGAPRDLISDDKKIKPKDAVDKGAAYTFKKNDNDEWVLDQVLEAPPSTQGRYLEFGSSFAVTPSADAPNLLLIGAPGVEILKRGDAGTVFAYQQIANDGVWANKGELNLKRQSEAALGFGAELASSGAELAVGTYCQGDLSGDPRSCGSGKAYVVTAA